MSTEAQSEDGEHSAPAIAVPLFDFISEAAAEINRYGVGEEIDGTDALIQFLENFIDQFSRSLGRPVIGLSRQSLTEWIALRRAHEGDSTPAAQRLMFKLDSAFTVVRELPYGGAHAEIQTFRTTYISEVLDAIIEWLSSTADRDQKLIDAAANAADAYRAACDHARSRPARRRCSPVWERIRSMISRKRQP